jgi:hypothetical protein
LEEGDRDAVLDRVGVEDSELELEVEGGGDTV